MRRDGHAILPFTASSISSTRLAGMPGTKRGVNLQACLLKSFFVFGSCKLQGKVQILCTTLDTDKSFLITKMIWNYIYEINTKSQLISFFWQACNYGWWEIKLFVEWSNVKKSTLVMYSDAYSQNSSRVVVCFEFPLHDSKNKILKLYSNF